jgi:hypothetical protein
VYNADINKERRNEMRRINGEFSDLKNDPSNDEYLNDELIELMKTDKFLKMEADFSLDAKLAELGFPPLDALKDAFSEEEQLFAIAAVLNHENSKQVSTFLKVKAFLQKFE